MAKRLAAALAIACIWHGTAIASRTLEAGMGHNLAVTATGEVWAWGMNDVGQLGNSTTINSSVPVRAGSLTGVIAVGAGGGTSVALRSDLTVWTWGYGTALGVTPPHQCLVPLEFSTDPVYVPCARAPVQVPGLTDITAVAVGGAHVVALRSNRTLVAWGSNRSGQLGDGTQTTRPAPAAVPGLTDVIAIAAGDAFTLALRADGTVWAWGDGSNGELGMVAPQACTGREVYDSTSTHPCSRSPVRITALSGVAAIAAGGRHGLVLKTDRTVWSWGSNHYGQIGDGTQVDRFTPQPVAGLSNAARIEAGFSHSIVVKQDGTFWAFGLNTLGQLGLPAGGDTCAPGFNPYCRKSPVAVPQHDGAIDVEAGGGHTVTVRPGGAIVAFGTDNSGQLGLAPSPNLTTVFLVDPHLGFAAGASASGGSLGTPSSGGLDLDALSGLNFTSTAIGVSSGAKEVRFTNTQESTIGIVSITTTGNFSRTHACPGSLPSYATCSIFVTFTPTGPGERRGALTVTTNFTENPSVSLEMSGTTPGTFDLSVAKIGMGTGTVTSSPSGIACGGTCVLGFTSPTLVTLSPSPSGGSVFAGWDGACTGTGPCTVTMSAARSVTAAFSPSSPVNGPAASPKVLYFGSKTVNTQTAARSVAITNSGTSTITITSVTVSAGFRVWHACSTLAAGASCPVSVAFTPVAEGALAGALTVASTAGSAVVTLSGTGLAAAFGTADLSISHAASPSPGSSGKDVVLTLTAVNGGPSAASEIVVTSAVPTGVSYIWASPQCTLVTGTIACTVGPLASGASAAMRLVVRRSAAGSISSNASVSGTPNDPASANNASSTVVQVNSTTAGVPVSRYRLYSPVTLEHHFTTDVNEYNTLGTFTGTWVKEGTVGKVLNNPGTFGGVTAVPYYRLYDTQTRWHHWTTDANEYYTLGLYPWWSQEGVDGWILPSAATGATQLFRLNYPHIPGLHHWTIDPNEYNTLINQYGWVGEPGAGFVVQ